ncbi:MAG: Orotidine 5'-phosphate decarboxylase [Candidatus Methanofastidiosum methylothiophilum]|nr:MAG: Orotidine 5'-phosphate decarboxylase [Candidatus Methanofastidiosum methylthiophilus]KYC47116.1 MAG: Orotidine 5'-phosphate decarboxylase [Candidatus Methanofastidiosum methylthiophilus]
MIKEDVRKRICLALDVDSLDLAREVVEESHEYVGLYKIGKELFVSEGISSIKIPQSFDRDVFLDLKFHDIPNTVEAASKALVKHNIKMFTIHSMGGKDMIQAAARGVNNGFTKYGKIKPIILGVTVLTSHNEKSLRDILIDKSLDTALVSYAKIASENGCDGLVCSPNDIRNIRPHISKEILYVTPGVRLRYDIVSDQKRVSTPEEAIINGSSLIVVGRSILKSHDRLEILKKIYKEVEKGLERK